MAEFSQLIKKFDKIRDYMRDFYVYGFKSRSDFTKKSPRTYDNEKRRCESYLGEYMKWDYTNKGKTSFVSVDCSKIPVNPLYSAWKSKSFTANDITLHFYLLDILKDGFLSIEEITDEISLKSKTVFDAQTVRNKCREYVKLGMIEAEKRGKSLCYKLAKNDFSITGELNNAISFFQGMAPFGEVGSYILDNNDIKNDIFEFKHNYIAHTLENGVLFELLGAIRKNRAVYFENQSERTGRTIRTYGLPLKIFVSTSTGRRFICMYSLSKKRFYNFRLDYIKKVTEREVIEEGEALKEKLNKNLDKVWGVGFGGRSRKEIISIKLFIDEEREGYIINRIQQEGHGGELSNIGKNVFLYTKEVFDMNDMSPWVKTFTGRILALEGTNREVVGRFYRDMKKLAGMYGIGGEE